MIHLASDPPSTEIQKVLEEMTNQVKGTRTEKIVAARDLWKAKNNTSDRKAVFLAAIEWLKSLSPYKFICQYCEHNEPSDIEHIYPKFFFPWKAFDWWNLLLSCKHCNTGFKLAKFAVFDSDGKLVKLSQKVEPISEKGVFVHPRDVDPSKFMLLNLMTYRFELRHPNGSEEYQMADFSIETLALNRRDVLLDARKKVRNNLLHLMRDLIHLQDQDSIPKLQALIHEKEFNWDRPLEEIQLGLIETFKQELLSAPHPSVWTAIKLQYTEFPEWQYIFKRLPQALQW